MEPFCSCSPSPSTQAYIQEPWSTWSGGNWLITISSTIYSAVKTVALDMTPSDWIDNTSALGALDGCLLSTHAFLLLVFAVACPLAAVFAAFDAFVNGVSGTRIRFWSWRKSRSSTSHEIYVFHELDEYGATLARSIIKARKKQLPLVIFANVGNLEASRDETLMEDLVDYARGKAFVLYTSLPAESIPHKLYRALGWRDTLSLLKSDYADLTKEGLGSDPVVSTKDELDRIKERIPLLKDTQHIDLRVHYYLCDSIDELGQR